MPIIVTEPESVEQPYVTLDDADGNPVTLHETTFRGLRTITGLFGVGSLRDSRRVRPNAHGGIDETRFEDGKLISLEGDVSVPGNQSATYDEFAAVVGVMLETLDVGPALLKWQTVGGSPPLQRLVRLASEVDPPIQEAAALLSYQAQFYAEDPRAYSQVLATVSSTDLSQASGGLVDPFTDPILASQSGGGLATFSNAGNRPTPPVFRIYGRCVDPQIVLVGSGRRIVLRGTVPADSYLELDVQARTVKMDGVTSQLGFLDSENSTWMEAPKGASQWQLISTDFDTSARLDVLGRSAYA